MDMEQIYILFENISETSAEKNSFLIERAVSFIKSRIIRNEDMLREEVEYLTALYANLYLIEKETANGIPMVSDGGGVISSDKRSYRLEMAKKMINEQEKLCKGYLIEKPISDFVFMSVKGGV